MNRIIKRLAVPLSAAAVLGTAGFAYMAANAPAPASYAGSGDTTVSGYQVSPIHFITAANYGGDAYVQKISFTLNHTADPANVGAYIYSDYSGAPSRYTNCALTDVATNTFTCSPYVSSQRAVLVSDVTKVTVTAAE